MPDSSAGRPHTASASLDIQHEARVSVTDRKRVAIDTIERLELALRRCHIARVRCPDLVRRGSSQCGSAGVSRRTPPALRLDKTMALQDRSHGARRRKRRRWVATREVGDELLAMIHRQ